MRYHIRKARKEVIKNVVIEGLVNLEVIPPATIDALMPCTSSWDQTPKSPLLPNPDLLKETQAPFEEKDLAHEVALTDQQTQLEHDIQLRRLQMEERRLQMEETEDDRDASKTP